MESKYYVYEVTYNTAAGPAFWETVYMISASVKNVAKYQESLGRTIQSISNLGEITESEILI